MTIKSEKISKSTVCRACSPSISIVIPTFNERATIVSCIDAIRANSVQPFEIIISDGGSTDGTVQIIHRMNDPGISLVQSPRRGRGNQIAAGITAASGDLIGIVHADTRLGVDSLAAIKAWYADKGKGGAVCFSQRYDQQTRFFRFIQWVNRWRVRWLGISFGDQVQVIPRHILDRCGGFPEVALMEDVEISLRLKAHGSKFRVLTATVHSSCRRWKGRNKAVHTVFVVALVGFYLLLRRLGRHDLYVENFYQAYYN